MIKLRSLLTETTLKTLHGSAIRRFKGNVGKQVGSQIYVHRDYVTDVIPHNLWSRALDILDHSNPGFKFNTVVFDPKAGTVRFDQAPDFDTAREPHVGDYIKIYLDGTLPPVQGHSDSIWHHKWMWVKDDYKGFNVDKAKEWSKLWLSKLEGPAKGTDATWSMQLRNVGLLMEAITNDQATAAIDFLKHMVVNGPFKGMVYLAGGPVRDMIMGKTPKDLDLSIVSGDIWGALRFTSWMANQMGNYKGPTTPPPKFPPHIKVDDYGAPVVPENVDLKKLAKEDPELFSAVKVYDDYYASYSNPVIFPKFGTAKINLKGMWKGVNLEGVEVEAVSARKEIYEPGNRKPIKVLPGTLQDDVMRRDFRANSLMYDLTKGETIDLTGQGVEDIKNKVLVTTSNPETIFSEDPLRMLRAVRFMVQKGFTIAPETAENIKKNASWLTRISRERIRDELDKMLVTADPGAAFRKMQELGLLKYVAPEFEQMIGMKQNIHHIDPATGEPTDVFDHTMSVLARTQPELVRRRIALFHDIGKLVTRQVTPKGVKFIGHETEGIPVARKVMSSLKYATADIDAVALGIGQHMRLKHGGDDAVKISDETLRRFKIAVGKYLDHVLDVIHADNVSHASASSMPNQIENVRRRLEAEDMKSLPAQPELPITGNDLIAAGYKPGPMFSKIMSAVTNAWYKNPRITKQDALNIAKSIR